MTGFTEQQIADLSAPLSRAHVKEREQSGRKVSYIEGWTVIAEANRIFGFDAWDRETIDCKCVAEREAKIGQQQADGWRVGYVAKVRVTVRPTEKFTNPIIREGTGYGSGIDRDLGAAHESAIKEAETDAMKRALMTFGNPFGLALYDKTQAEVEPLPQRGAQKPVDARSPSPPQRPAQSASPPQAPTSGQLPPPNPEEPPEIAEARRIARSAFWTRDDYGIDPAVIQGGMARWDAEMLAQAEAAPTLDAFLKLRDENEKFFMAWARQVRAPVVDAFNARMDTAYQRVARLEGVAA